MSNYQTFIKGLLKENPVFVMMLGMCPSMAVTTMASNGLGMGLSTTFVLICSNFIISLLKNVIPKEVRLPCYIVIIAGFVTFVSILLKAYIPSLYGALGIFLNLITVNCIILARAEVFASKNGPVKSILDGAGIGLGFTGALLIIGSVREILGSGTFFEQAVIPADIPNMTIFILPAGGFFTLGVIIAIVGKITKKPVKETGCGHCPGREVCGGYSDESEGLKK